MLETLNSIIATRKNLIIVSLDMLMLSGNYLRKHLFKTRLNELVIKLNSISS
jgi:hypothetical protein